MTAEFDDGPRLLYRSVANGERVQASGTAEPGAVTLTTEYTTKNSRQMGIRRVGTR